MVLHVEAEASDYMVAVITIITIITIQVSYSIVHTRMIVLGGIFTEVLRRVMIENTKYRSVLCTILHLYLSLVYQNANEVIG